MKKLLLIITILSALQLGCSAQSFESYANKYLGAYVKEGKVTVVSDYGTMVIKFNKNLGCVYKMWVSLPNGSNAAVMMEDSTDYQTRRTGSRWSDFSFSIPKTFMERKKFSDNYDEIMEYYEIHKGDRVKVYKHVNKDKWVCLVMDKNYANNDKWIKLH